MTEIAIRDARSRDIADIAGLESRAFPSPWRREFFINELQSPRRYNRVAEVDGAFAGYLFAMHFLDEMHVNKVAVMEGMRRRRIASALMSDSIAFARREGISSISLEVRESNREARDFYRALHFRDLYVRSRYYPDGENAVVMTASV